MVRFFTAFLATVPAVSALYFEDGTGRLPAMGWNSWNAYHCDVDAAKIMQAANAMKDKGFQDAGYNYVNCDDCWSMKDGRDNTTHQLRPNITKFPDGIDGLASKLHSMGFKAGIYSSAGYETCGGYPASLDYEMIDAETFAGWGIDYLKYDNCGVPSFYDDTCYACNADPTFATNLVNGSCTNSTVQEGAATMMPICSPEWPVDGRNYSQSYTALRFRVMQHALQAQNHSILFSLCEWGTDEPWTWANSTGNSWRMSNDIQDTWEDILRILNINSFLTNYGNFYGHNDPDMLEVGNGNITEEESRTHFAMWALMKAPLLIGTDVTNLSQTNIDILQNKRLIAFNQDATYGKPAGPYKWGTNPDWTYNASFPAEYWSGDSSDGVMVAMFNPFNETRSMTAVFDEIPQLSESSYNVVNVWTGEQMGCEKNSVKMNVKAHDTAVLLMESTCSGSYSRVRRSRA